MRWMPRSRPERKCVHTATTSAVVHSESIQEFTFVLCKYPVVSIGLVGFHRKSRLIFRGTCRRRIVSLFATYSSTSHGNVYLRVW